MTTLEVTAYVDVEDVIRRLPSKFMPNAIRITPQLWFGCDCYASAATTEELEALLLLYVQSQTLAVSDEAQSVEITTS